jgi:hypothetical protein
MKNKVKIVLLILFLWIDLKAAFAQSKVKRDTIYYVIDTAKIPVNARMLDIGVEGPYKYYTIQCPCLEYGQRPNFTYRRDVKDKLMTASQLKSIKQVNLISLIQKAKEFTNKAFTSTYAFFFIEPNGKGYVIHQVHLATPINQEPIVDFITVTNDTVKTRKP